MRWTMEYAENRQLPKFYGFAYSEFTTGHVVLYPVPFNILARKFRDLWFWLKQRRVAYRENVEHSAYEHGEKQGRAVDRACYERKIELEKSRMSYVSTLMFHDSEFLDRNVPRSFIDLQMLLDKRKEVASAWRMNLTKKIVEELRTSENDTMVGTAEERAEVLGERILDRLFGVPMP